MAKKIPLICKRLREEDKVRDVLRIILFIAFSVAVAAFYQIVFKL